MQTVAKKAMARNRRNNDPSSGSDSDGDSGSGSEGSDGTGESGSENSVNETEESKAEETPQQPPQLTFSMQTLRQMFSFVKQAIKQTK